MEKILIYITNLPYKYKNIFKDKLFEEIPISSDSPVPVFEYKGFHEKADSIAFIYFDENEKELKISYGELPQGNSNNQILLIYDKENNPIDNEIVAYVNSFDEKYMVKHKNSHFKQDELFNKIEGIKYAKQFSHVQEHEGSQDGYTYKTNPYYRLHEIFEVTTKEEFDRKIDEFIETFFLTTLHDKLDFLVNLFEGGINEGALKPELLEAYKKYAESIEKGNSEKEALIQIRDELLQEY